MPLAGVAHLVERDLAKVEVASSSLVARSKNKTPSEGMGFCFWNAAGRFELTASTCAKHVKFRGEAGFLRMAMPFAGCREASSSLVARSTKNTTTLWVVVFFVERRFCCAKSVACGRVTEREWGNPSKVPPSHSPFLAVCGSANNKTCGQSQKETPSVRVVFLYGMSRADDPVRPHTAQRCHSEPVLTLAWESVIPHLPL